MARKPRTEINFIPQLSINRISGSDNETPMRITIEDATSGTRILEAEFTLGGFMQALTAQYGIKGKGTLWLGPIGFKQETKTEVVQRPKGLKDKDEVAKIIAPFEIDGWRGDTNDPHNHHRWVGTDKVTVLFRRYVNEQGEVWGQP